MATETLYFRNDSHTVNTVSGYKLGNSQSSGTAVRNYCFTSGYTSPANGRWKCNVVKVENDGTETTLGSGVAITERTHITSGTAHYGYQNVNWTCPETSLDTTDAIKIYKEVRSWDAGSVDKTSYETCISSQLGWTKLTNVTWTFYRFTFLMRNEVLGFQVFDWWGGQAEVLVGIYEDTTNARIINIGYITYLDKGLRLYNGSSVIKIGVQALNGHALRFYNGSTTYGVPLINPGGSDDSGVRIYDGSNVKALPKVA